MVWNVYRCDINSRQVEIYNIFEHGGFIDAVKKLMKKKIKKDEFSEELRIIVGYFFRARIQWEMSICFYPVNVGREEIERVIDEREKFYRKEGKFPYLQGIDVESVKKIDVYEQVKLNWEIFLDYVWGNK